MTALLVSFYACLLLQPIAHSEATAGDEAVEQAVPETTRFSRQNQGAGYEEGEDG